MGMLENDPILAAMDKAGQRMLGRSAGAKRLRFSGGNALEHEKLGQENLYSRARDVADIYGRSAEQELSRWAPEAQLDFARQTEGFDDSLDIYRAGTVGDFSRYGASQNDVRNLILANNANNSAWGNYDAAVGANQAIPYMYNLMEFYGA